VSIHELREAELLSELLLRAGRRAHGLCDYCGRTPDTDLCQFPDRHEGREPGPPAPIHALLTTVLEYESGATSAVDLFDALRLAHRTNPRPRVPATAPAPATAVQHEETVESSADPFVDLFARVMPPPARADEGAADHPTLIPTVIGVQGPMQYEGDPCGDCGAFTVVFVSGSFKCVSCGACRTGFDISKGTANRQ
jgi:hypothetical protein